MRRPVFFNKSSSRSTFSTLDSSAIQAFHRNLEGYEPTPLVPLPNVAIECNVKKVLIKDESERFGLPAFKILGASWGAFWAIISQLDLPHDTDLNTLAEAVQKHSIKLFTATDGNHGRALAHMAKLLSAPCEIYVPSNMCTNARTAISIEGAIIIQSTTYDQAVKEAAIAAQATKGGILIQDTAFPGYLEIPEQIAQAYSTMLIEIDEQLQALGDSPDIVICPVGVGSLALAVTRHFKSKGLTTKVIAVEPDTAACLYKSLQAGEPISLRTSATIMTGLDCGTISQSAWPCLSAGIDASVSVSDFEAHSAVENLATSNISAGPCGAAGLAALRLLVKSYREQLLIGPETTVLLLNTEGKRFYRTPYDVSSNDPIALTQVLTQIESSNPALSVLDGSGEEAIADYIESWLQHRDIEIHRLASTPQRPSVVGIVHGTAKGRSLMINAHIDTVSLQNYGPNPLSGTLSCRDGRDAILGRGSLDMKAGLAAGMTALSYAKANRTAGTVILATVADEEDSSEGTRQLIAAGWRADGAIIPEPTQLKLCTAHRGFVWIEVSIEGLAAHGSEYNIGIDAIMKTGKFLEALNKYQDQLPTDDVLGKASLHCGLIKGGQKPSTYPATCTVTVEFRTVPGQTPELILQDIKSILDDIAQRDANFRFVNPRITLHRPPYRLPDEHPFASATMKAARTVLNEQIEFDNFAAWCDAALLGEAGTPTVVFGPAGKGLHAKDEWVDVDSIKTTEKFIQQLILDFCV